MAKKRAENLAQNDAESLEPIAKLWMLRTLAHLEIDASFFERLKRGNSELARQIGFGDLVDREGEVAPKKIRTKLLNLYKDAEQNSHHLRTPQLLRDNIERLGELIGLAQTELRILEFAIMLHTDAKLCRIVECLGELTTERLIYSLSVILVIPKQDVFAALLPRALLAQSGLLKVDKYRHTMDNKLDLLSRGFSEHMTTVPLNLTELMRESISTASAAKLTFDDYLYLSSFIDVLRLYISKAMETRKIGVNVLLYGQPGTGKSEMVRALAQTLGYTLFEVSSEDEDGDPRDGEQRLRGFRSAQCLFAKQKNVMLVFDEVEDIFRGGMFTQSAADKSKGWVNRMLESNSVPTIWLSNDARCLDRAFVRRFDLVKEIPIPPKPIREQILRNAAGGMLGDAAIKRLAQAGHLSPAVVTRSAAVVRCVQEGLADGPEKAMEAMIADTMTAQGLKRILKEDPAHLPEVYDPMFINTGTDMAELMAGVKESRSARICLYGAPGTGKTAFGRWVAEQLDVPLHIKRASDILSAWLGESEQNIARAFQEAEAEGAVLLIDEVDSFLQDRAGAKQHWEISTVNEMLTQMEAYSGVFIASTNLMNGLDEAALRRFDLKVKFDYLRQDQAWTLFQRHCSGMGLVPDGDSEACVKALSNLAPGDFAAVIRQSKFRPMKSATAFAQTLGEECALKKSGKKARMGFLA